MDGLTQGRVVHFTNADGTVSPAIVSHVWHKDTGMVNLHVLQQNDSHPVRLVTSVVYSEEPTPGAISWHWIPRA
jgi:hypothetical protein